MKQPLIFFAIFFVIGIVFAQYVSIPAGLLLIGLFAAFAGACFFLKNENLFFLSKIFEIYDLCIDKYFLGVENIQAKNKNILTQKKYIKDFSCCSKFATSN